LIIGHRGAAGLEPENTLRSFRRAEKEGADVIELDLHLSRDGRLVVIHDPTVNRTTGERGKVAEMTLDQLKALDAGIGERIPTFEEALEATDLPIHAEVKAVEAGAALAGFIREHDLDGRVTPTSFHPEALGGVRSVMPEMEVGLILARRRPDADELARSVGAVSVALEARYVDEEVVERCRAAGLQVIAWTVNDPNRMKRVAELGVDAITSDRPDILAGVLGR
jgi:glycerophosphoryl diester phosphodiesterase